MEISTSKQLWGTQFFAYIRKRRYEILLCSFVLLIFGNTFNDHRILYMAMNIYQNLIIGLLVFYNKKWVRIFIGAILLITILLDIFEADLAFLNVRSIHSYLYIFFFSLVVKEVYKEILYVKSVSREMLAAVLCGFVLLCLIATFVFYQIHLYQSDAFSNVGTGIKTLDNLNYFSFTTLLTVGYGDITPVTLVAKRAVMMVGLAGHFYTVFITSIIIGKYLSAKNNDQHDGV